MKVHENGATKVCGGCKAVKPVEDFYTRKIRSGRYIPTSRCKACFKVASDAGYLRNREKRLKQCAERRKLRADEIAEYLRGWYKKNKQRILPRIRAYQTRPERKEADRIRQKLRYLDNKAEITARRVVYRATPEYKAMAKRLYKRHYEANKIKYTLKSIERMYRKRRATPGWYKRGDARPFYELAARLTKETGVRHVVDHIVPLKGANVCGLHVKENLRVIPELDNIRKHNKLVEEIVRY